MLLAAPLVISQKNARILLEQFQSDELLLEVKRPGEAIVKVRWTPYWFASHACVEPYGAWTKVIADEVGFVHMSTRFAPEELFAPSTLDYPESRAHEGGRIQQDV